MSVFILAWYNLERVLSFQGLFNIFSGVTASVLQIIRRRTALDGLIPDTVNPAGAVFLAKGLMRVGYPGVDKTQQHIPAFQIQYRLILYCSNTGSIQRHAV